MPGSVVANSSASKLKLGPTICTNPAQSRLADPVAFVLLAVAVSPNRVEAPVVLLPVVTVVFCFLRFLALVASFNFTLLFFVVSASSAARHVSDADLCQ